jgi:hypothetical protein
MWQLPFYFSQLHYHPDHRSADRTVDEVHQHLLSDIFSSHSSQTSIGQFLLVRLPSCTSASLVDTLHERHLLRLEG